MESDSFSNTKRYKVLFTEFLFFQSLMNDLFFQAIQQVTWHGKGDYFSVVLPDGKKFQYIISCISIHNYSIILFDKTVCFPVLNQ